MKMWRALLSGTAISPPIGGFFFCTSPSIDLRSTGSLASAAREVTDAGIDVLQPLGEERRVGLGVCDLLRQRLHQRLLALLGRAGLQCVVMRRHKFPRAFSRR